MENKGNWELKLSKNRLVKGRNKKVFENIYKLVMENKG